LTEIASKSSSKDVDVAICSSCKKEYNIIEGVIIILHDNEDFYNYNRKLARYIELKKVGNE
jgi:hypothetical protein